MARSENIKTPLARLAFSNSLFKMQTTQSGKLQWGATLLFPKTADITPIRKLAEEAAVAEWGDKVKALIAAGTLHNPFLDGDGPQGKSKKTGAPHEGFPGHWFIRCISGESYRPKLVNQQLLPIVSEEELYSGCYVYAVINAFTWENVQKGKGISFGLSMVQKVRDGEKIGSGGGGSSDPESFFEKIQDDGAPPFVPDGKGAAGLFG